MAASRCAEVLYFQSSKLTGTIWHICHRICCVCSDLGDWPSGRTRQSPSSLIFSSMSAAADSAWTSFFIHRSNSQAHFHRARLGCYSGLDANAFSKNTIRSDPAVDSTAIVADLESFAADGLYEVKIFSTSYLAEHDVSDRECGTIDRRDSAEVTGFDAPLHRCASGAKRNSLSCAELFNVVCCPTHVHTMLSCLYRAAGQR
jgi:hypothetical protein